MIKLMLLLIILLLNSYNGDSQGVWVWMHGDSSGSPMVQSSTEPVYGNLGIGSNSTSPGMRYTGASCIDKNGDFWLYSGQSVTALSLYTNDLWKYETNTNKWIWMKGPQLSTSLNPIKGTRGIPSPSNQPGSCILGGMMVCDTNNNLWLITEKDNMLWKYNISDNEWTWMHGIEGMFTAVYGTQGVSSPSNMPPHINESQTMLLHRKTNTIWILDNNSDMWKYNIGTNEFTWVHGNHGLYANYGTKYVESSANYLKNSIYAFHHTAWIDDDYYYLFQNKPSIMWRYNFNSNMWAWISGDDTLQLSLPDNVYNKNYCDFKDSAYVYNTTEARGSSLPNSDYLWLYGGFDSVGLWVFNKKLLSWNWIEGGAHATKPIRHGIKGVPDVNNFPSISIGGHSQWIDGCGNIWFYGGFQTGINSKAYNTLWKYIPDTLCFKSQYTIDLPISFKDTILCIGDIYKIAFPYNLDFEIFPMDDVRKYNSHVEIVCTKPEVNYTIVVKKVAPCNLLYSFKVIGINCDTSKLLIPNAFTPNGDNLNDKIGMISKDINLHEFAIFNRWGQNVFKTMDIYSQWDGKFNSKDCAIGTYFYYIRYSVRNSKEIKIIKGAISLLR